MANQNDDAYIHLHVTHSTKGRWVKASRSSGMKLTDWITMAVENYISQSIVRMVVPDELRFSDLQLAMEADGSLSFDWGVIERISIHNNVPISLLDGGPEDNVAAMIIAWHMAHLAQGGEPDPVVIAMEQEVAIEDKSGNGISHSSGRA